MTRLLRDPYLEPDPLSNLKFYRYSAVDKSLVYNHVLRHWSDLAVKAFPMWMAPNVITLSGFGFILTNVALLAVYIPDLSRPAPSWVYLSFAIGLFLYQTFDNVDGKQARRTGTSSALGHIFDHTIDSLNCALGGLIQVASLGVGLSYKAVFFVLVACGAMWFSTWEEYHTGTLYLGYFNGPTEGVLIACVIHIISAIFGPQFWLRPLRSVVPLRWIPPSWHLHDLILAMALLSLLFIHIPECLLNVYHSRRTSSRPFLPTLAQHIPLFTFLLLALAWPLSPSSFLLDQSLNASKRVFIEYALLVMFAFGKLSPRIILARLTHSKFPWWNFGAFMPLGIGAIYVSIPEGFFGFTHSPVTERKILLLALSSAGFAFLHWSYCLIQGFTQTLKIGCFKIKNQRKGTITPT